MIPHRIESLFIFLYYSFVSLNRSCVICLCALYSARISINEPRKIDNIQEKSLLIYAKCYAVRTFLIIATILKYIE